MNASHDQATAAEYDALVNGCGLVPLDPWAVVTVAGNDRQSFLHNMCTNGISHLKSGEGCEAFCTDVKGKIVAHVFVVLDESHIVLISVPGQAESIVQHLDRYIIREDVRLADASAVQQWTLVAGNQAVAVLGHLSDDQTTKLQCAWQNTSGTIGGVDARIVRFPLPGRMAFLVGTVAEQSPRLRGQLGEAGARVCHESAWTSLRVEAGLPQFRVDFDASNLPQEVSRNEQAISFTKGCYLGQETVARIDALGHVNKQIVTLKYPSGASLEPNTPLTQDGQQVGLATTVAWSPELGAPLALGMVRRGYNEVGTTLDSPYGTVEVIATPAHGG